MGSTPDDPLPPPGRDLDWSEGIIALSLHAGQHRRRKRNRQQRRQQRSRYGSHQVLRPIKMSARDAPQLGKGRIQLGASRPSGQCLPVRAMPLQHLNRHKELTLAGMDGKCIEQSDNGVCHPGMMGNFADIRLTPSRQGSCAESMISVVETASV